MTGRERVKSEIKQEQGAQGNGYKPTPFEMYFGITFVEANAAIEAMENIAKEWKEICDRAKGYGLTLVNYIIRSGEVSEWLELEGHEQDFMSPLNTPNKAVTKISVAEASEAIASINAVLASWNEYKDKVDRLEMTLADYLIRTGGVDCWVRVNGSSDGIVWASSRGDTRPTTLSRDLTVKFSGSGATRGKRVCETTGKSPNDKADHNHQDKENTQAPRKRQKRNKSQSARKRRLLKLADEAAMAETVRQKQKEKNALKIARKKRNLSKRKATSRR
ncbi:MAG: hypothetical protein UW69_C0041G0007 [Microgenomates group bacterium GW2011_GWA2_44_7]|nr:MAG: hypothetical protein UW69_C0041G0007 [Microgenomates group bacterium GW2011_GWA2_44_7]